MEERIDIGLNGFVIKWCWIKWIDHIYMLSTLCSILRRWLVLEVESARALNWNDWILNSHFSWNLYCAFCVTWPPASTLPSFPKDNFQRAKGQSFRGRGRAIISWRWPSIKFFNKHNRKGCKLDIYSMTFSSIQNFVHCKNNSRVHVSSV